MSTSADVAPSVSALERLLVAYARRFPVRRGKLRVVEALWRRAAAGRGTARMAALAHGGFSMSCDINEMLQRQIYFFGTYQMEADLLEIWVRESKNATTVFDVGANAGIFGLDALAANGNATVHAFEPTPEIARRLRATVALNGLERLHVHELAVFNCTGRASLRRFRGSTGSNEGMNFITADGSDERICTVSLDDFCERADIERIDLLKLDIQGQEHEALAGASRLLEAGRVGTIFIELNWAADPYQVCPASESIRMLTEAGYAFARPSRALHWQRAGSWIGDLNEVIARR